MKHPRKNNLAQAGFTLVEVIVVAVIVAAMAAVAVPMYLGYVESSRINAAANAAGSIASFCGACVNAGGDEFTAGVVTDSIVCENERLNPQPVIKIPADIEITLTDGPPRGVEAKHVDADSIITYSY